MPNYALICLLRWPGGGRPSLGGGSRDGLANRLDSLPGWRGTAGGPAETVT